MKANIASSNTALGEWRMCTETLAVTVLPGQTAPTHTKTAL